MGSMNYFCQMVQEILQNIYLKSHFENSEVKDFVPISQNFIRGKFPKKCPIFWTLNAHISRTVNARELNEAILKSSY